MDNLAIPHSFRYFARHCHGLPASLAIVFSTIVNDLTNFANLMAYCGGFALGNYLGMVIEQRYITSYMTVTVIVQEKGHEIALALRDHGYGVTETIGEGRDGTVTMLRSVILQRDIPNLLKVVRDVYPDAFVSVEEARASTRAGCGRLVATIVEA